MGTEVKKAAEKYSHQSGRRNVGGAGVGGGGWDEGAGDITEPKEGTIKMGRKASCNPSA